MLTLRQAAAFVGSLLSQVPSSETVDEEEEER